MVMVVSTMCKFVLFGPFYSKIGLDPCITVVSMLGMLPIAQN